MNHRLLLKTLFRQLQETKLPQFTKNQNLNPWIEDLILIDSYIAGYASVGEKVPKKDIPDIKGLEESLSNLSINTECDRQTLIHCISRLDLLKKKQSIL